MMYFFRLALKNVFSRRSSAVIIVFITLAISLLMIVNAVFDSTDEGIEAIFRNSFTGDIVVRECSKENTSLFGNVSIIDESVIPTKELTNLKALKEFLSSYKDITVVPMITTISRGNWKVKNLKSNDYLLGYNSHFTDIYNNLPDSEIIKQNCNSILKKLKPLSRPGQEIRDKHIAQIKK